MPCPYLEEVNMRYCRAFPIRKMIPSSSSQALSPCLTSGYLSCSVYDEVSHLNEEKLKKLFRQIAVPEKKPLIPAIEEPSETEGKKLCVWLRQEIVSYRLCNKNYECEKCEFHQMLQDKDAKYIESPEVVRAINKMRTLPATQRKCKYQVLGKILYHYCDYDYECWRCPTCQTIRENVVEQVIEEARV